MVPPPGMAPCAAGSIVEVLVSATGAPRREDIDVTAHSPSGRAVPLEARHPPPSAPGTTASSATFQPDEAGTWTIAITYKGEHIQVTLFILTSHHKLEFLHSNPFLLMERTKGN